MIKKLRQTKAETLIETLASLVVIIMSVLVISTCIMSAMRINEQTREADEKYRNELHQAEGQQGASVDARVEIRFETGMPVYVGVQQYGSEEGAFVSYDYSQEVTP